MGVSVMILGVSGTGKSCSMRNFGPDDIALVNVAGKPLPFKGKFNEVLNSDNYEKVIDFIKDTDKKSIVVDDAQYLMSDEFMRRATEGGYTKFSEIAKNFYDLIETIRLLPDDKIVYMLGHTERDADGNEKFRTVGKLIDEKINVEGMCTIVLKTAVSDGQYTFLTQNNGHDTTKSPMGMFDSYSIDNDLKYVDEKIRNYYDMDGAVSDEEIKRKDKEAEVQKEKPTRRSRTKTKEPEPEAPNDFMNIPEDAPEEIPFEEEPKTLGRTTYFYIEADDNYVCKHAGDIAPEGGRKITKKEFDEGCVRIAQEKQPARRTRRTRKENDDE